MREGMSGLTVEQRAYNFETMRHIERVRNLLGGVVVDLLRRAAEHDQSKLESPEVEIFSAADTPSLGPITYGTPEYEASRKKVAPALAHHYAKNAHHPEFQRRDEVWVPVTGFKDRYEVSNYGDIRSIPRVAARAGQTGDLTINGRVLQQYITPKGYCRLQLTGDEGKKSNLMAHRIVAEAFIPNPENKPEVNHKDGNKTNNKVTNLEWSTSSENLVHAYDTGLKQACVKWVVTCEETGISTFGFEEMEADLKRRGYDRVSASGIYCAATRGGSHYDLHFATSVFERWMNSPVNDMTLVDVLEMFVDWKASSERHHDGNILKSIEKNADRFGLSPQLVRILENTAKAMGYLQ